MYRKVTIWLAVLIVLGYGIYIAATFSGTEAHVLEWMNLVFRWAHVILGISWIGASFYFIFLENSLNRTENLRDELAGNLWAIHGGGFYYVEKYKVAPEKIPQHLHWFKYEAYFTWLTGCILLVLVYYINAKSVLVDPAVSDISPLNAILLSVGTLVAGWFCYDFLCKTKLLEKKKTFALTGFSIVILISFFLSQFLSGRAAFMHVGALLGTIMAGNVFFTIIPSQKALVKAAKLGLPLDPTLGKTAGLRSLHNNYITLPVIFIMISGHFPTTYGNAFNWAVLAGLTLASVAVRHYINLYEKGRNAFWILPFSFIALISLVIVTAPKKTEIGGEPASFTEVSAVIQKRCQSCHAQKPSDPEHATAAGGVILESPDQIRNMADRIMVRVVQTKTMPQGNKTEITEEERELLGRWISQGSVLNQ
ncbi:MAG: hypothetical protein DWQ44_01910 [Bacteroidetes bacterium]|nr:MAG: hypothetical protein DWQ33_05640 [Bacteroidota bacterium]REK05318.1 MAG: hypothetical protein DWQ39_05805 [Bacteroidota bacterium]REK36386.1 MAG: hypothetical protein DWQ44_01910 [Bacteroidota bacterium]REK51520.1 MAG: hypothetical protein DWQ48_00925 [Bacteroidota bacterium]